MWLIADSGSTKTEWVLFDPMEKKKLLTSGLNPLFLSGSGFKSKLRESVPNDWLNEVTKLWFYAAGCGTDKIKESTTRWLKTIFTKADVHVNSDLMAAARATCGTNEGIIAILGTGSNSCYFDGQHIANQVKPLGFILGDEGSGAALGKSLLKKLLRNQLQPELSSAIYNDLGMDYDEIMNRVYHQITNGAEWPNRFIASCSRVLHRYKADPGIKAIIVDEFDHFVNILLLYESQTKINFVGSIAYYFKGYLNESLHKHGLESGVILKSPTNSLVGYHLKNS